MSAVEPRGPLAGRVDGSAPGRVNLMGEHTDYNGGWVLPLALPHRTRVTLAPLANRRVCVASRQMGGETRSYALGDEAPGHGWLDYVQGVTWVLREEGYRLGGFEAAIDSDVPLGSGLASSAALLVSLVRALREAFRLSLDDVRLALLAHRAENDFVGARVGNMDQLAASLADAETALFLDTRTLAYERVPWPLGADLVVIDSGVAHDHAAGDYNTRRAECERASALLGVAQLRDVGAAGLSRLAALPERLRSRARHVVTENERALAAVAALRAGDLPRLGALFYASHVSQRDDYEVSVPEVDLLVDLARTEADVFGARLTGGGFGGAVVVLVRAGAARAVARRIAHAYAVRSGRTPRVVLPTPDGRQDAALPFV